MATLQIAAAEPLSAQDRDYLEENGARTVTASVHYSRLSNELSALRNPNPHVPLDEINTFIVRAPGKMLLEAAAIETVKKIEIIDDDEANRISSLLAAVSRTDRLDKNIFDFGVLNISLGVPAVKYGTHRTADDTVRRAIQHLIEHRRIPVVMSIGNDGPTPGLVNPWALTTGVFIAAATDSTGNELWTASSRFREGEGTGRRLFAAHGYLSVGPLAAGTSKTREMLEAEKKVNLTAIVGAGNEHLYRVDSGTSYAAAIVTKALCLVHQATQLLRLQMNAAAPLHGVLPPFIRAYADTGIDATHPAFANRVAGSGRVYSGLTVDIRRERRTLWVDLFERRLALDVTYTDQTALEMLKRSAVAVPNTTFDQTGYGFVSNVTVANMLTSLTFPDLIGIYGRPEAGSGQAGLNLMQSIDGPVFSLAEVDQLEKYCRDYDLAFMSKVN